MALKHTQLGAERRSTGLPRHYDHPRVNPAELKQLGEESTTGAGSESGDPYRKLRHHHGHHQHHSQHQQNELAQREQQRDLRRHLRDLLSVSSTAGGGSKHQAAATGGPSVDVPPSNCSSRTPSLMGLHAVQVLHDKIAGLQRMKGRQTGPATTTTVTREKNKLIIKQQPLQQQSDARESSSKRRQR